MPEEQRHRIKLLWPIEQGGMGTTLEKKILYSRFSYKGPMPKSSLFVFYENDKDYLETFSKQWYYPLTLTTLGNNAGIPGFFVSAGISQAKTAAEIDANVDASLEHFHKEDGRQGLMNL